MGPGGRRRRVNTNAETSDTHELGSNSSGTEKNVRKRAANNTLTDFLDRGGAKPHIEIIALLKIPLGPWAKQWVTELGIIVRKHVPLECHTWKKVPNTKKTNLFERVLDKFDVDFTDAHTARSVEDHMKRLYKDYRCELHTHYLTLPDGIDKTQYPRNDVNQADWARLCVWYENPDFKKRCAATKRSRKENKTLHRGGSRCFPRAMHEFKDPETNEKPDAIKFYKLTHHSSKKGWSAPRAEENYEKMVDMSMEPVEEGSTPPTADTIREKVLGVRSGYVPGLGYGVLAPTRTNRDGSGAAAAAAEINQLRTRAENAEGELQELRVQHQQLRVQYDQVEEKQHAQQLQLDYILSRMGGPSSS